MLPAQVGGLEGRLVAHFLLFAVLAFIEFGPCMRPFHWLLHLHMQVGVFVVDMAVLVARLVLVAVGKLFLMVSL